MPGDARRTPCRPAEHSHRAVPDRRQQPRLPRLLRAARDHCDLARLSHQRDLRLRLDAGEDPRRAWPAPDAGDLGRRVVGTQGGLRRVQGAAQLEARPAARAVAAPRAAGRSLWVSQRQGPGIRGRRRDRHAGASRARGGDRRDDRHGRPRRPPAGGAGGQRDGHQPRHHRHEDLRAPDGDRPLRDPARADSRLLRPQGRHLRQHPGGAGNRRQDSCATPPALRRPRDRARQRGRDLRCQTKGEPDQPRRRRARVQAAGHGQPRGRGRDRPGGGRRGRARPFAPAFRVPRV